MIRGLSTVQVSAPLAPHNIQGSTVITSFEWGVRGRLFPKGYCFVRYIFLTVNKVSYDVKTLQLNRLIRKLIEDLLQKLH